MCSRPLPLILSEFPEVVYIVLGATHPNELREHGEAYRLSLEILAKKNRVDKNVIFYNQFVDLENLKEFIGAADLYITPYLNEAQITSRTLAYAFGPGKAVVSTPYWHAAECWRRTAARWCHSATPPPSRARPGAMINYLQKWMDQLRWQRLKPFEELADTLLKHLDGIANYCRTKVRMGVVEAVNVNIRMLINRGRGYTEPALPAAQGQATRGQQPRTPRCPQNRQSRVVCPLCQILAQCVPAKRGFTRMPSAAQLSPTAFIAAKLCAHPLHPFSTDLIVPVRAAKTIYVRFDLNDHSVPPGGSAAHSGGLRHAGADFGWFCGNRPPSPSASSDVHVQHPVVEPVLRGDVGAVVRRFEGCGISE